MFALCAETSASDCEITLEVNPQDVTRRKNYRQWETIGINRVLSLGLQTFNAQHLHFFAPHNTQEHRDETQYYWQQQFFADNLSVDLIYGFPQQRMQNFETDIAAVLALPLYASQSLQPYL